MSNLKYLTPDEKKAVQLLVKKLKAQLNNQLDQIKIFGSKVKGTFHEGSDIDVLLIVNERTQEILDQIAAIHLELDLQFDLNISLVIYSKHEFEKNASFESPFFKNLQRESIDLC